MTLLDENNIDLPELKAIYDELWVDAKALAKDMKLSIINTLYAAYATMIILLTSILSASPHFYLIATGNFNALSIFTVVFLAIGAVILSVIAHRLFRMHYKLKEKYSKLIALGDKTE